MDAETLVEKVRETHDAGELSGILRSEAEVDITEIKALGSFGERLNEYMQLVNFYMSLKREANGSGLSVDNVIAYLVGQFNVAVVGPVKLTHIPGDKIEVAVDFLMSAYVGGRLRCCAEESRLQARTFLRKCLDGKNESYVMAMFDRVDNPRKYYSRTGERVN